jgi:hypothetical protein
MSTRMKRAPDAGDSQQSSQFLKVTKQIPLAQLLALKGAENEAIFVAGEMSVESLARLNAHWYESFFVALSLDPQAEVVKIHIIAKKAEQFVQPQPGIESREDNGPQAHSRTLDGFVIHQPLDVLKAKRR